MQEIIVVAIVAYAGWVLLKRYAPRAFLQMIYSEFEKGCSLFGLEWRFPKGELAKSSSSGCGGGCSSCGGATQQCDSSNLNRNVQPIKIYASSI